MIYLTTLVFPIVAIAAGMGVVKALLQFIAEIQKDLRGPPSP